LFFKFRQHTHFMLMFTQIPISCKRGIRQRFAIKEDVVFLFQFIVSPIYLPDPHYLIHVND